MCLLYWLRRRLGMWWSILRFLPGYGRQPKHLCGDSEHFRKARDAVSLFLFPVRCLFFSIWRHISVIFSEWAPFRGSVSNWIEMTSPSVLLPIRSAAIQHLFPLVTHSRLHRGNKCLMRRLDRVRINNEMQILNERRDRNQTKPIWHKRAFSDVQPQGSPISLIQSIQSPH